MKKLFILFALIAINKAADTEYESCSSFEEIKESYCRNLYSSFPNECEGYPSEYENFVDDICTSITPTAPNKKCKVSTEGSQKICQTVDKECKDYKEGNDCKSFNAGSDTKRCVLINNKKCEAHSNSCTGLTINECSTNIPQDNKYKCVWNSDQCQQEQRICSDYIVYSDKNGESSCNSLKHTSPKSCILTGDECYEGYLRCEDGNGKEDICNVIKPLKTDNTTNPLLKCEYQGTNCIQVQKKCSDFKKGEDDEEFCEQFTSSNSNYKKCVLENHDCKEKYISCNFYDKDSSQKTAEDCANIILEGYEGNVQKCEFNEFSNTCYKVVKECNEITKEYCDHIYPNNEEKACILKNNFCQEIYRSCELYNNKMESKNEEECKLIPIFIDQKDNVYYGCDFEKNTSICKKKKRNVKIIREN